MKLSATITFLEPYRLSLSRKDYGVWLNPRDNRGQDPKRKGRPSLHGDQLRGKVLGAVAHLLWLKEGNWERHACCNGVNSPDHPNLKGDKEPVCWPEEAGACTADDPCLFCLLLGCYDPPDPKDVKNKLCSVQFDNGYTHRFYPEIEVVGEKRRSNRLDPVTGKAFDYHSFWSFWEIDQDMEMTAVIRVADAIPEEKRQVLVSLITAALALVDTLSGALCTISLDVMDLNCRRQAPISGPVDAVTVEQRQEIKDVVDRAIRPILAHLPDAAKLRTMAEATLPLRSSPSKEAIERLPKGPRDKDGKTTHYLYDLKPLELRAILRENVETYQHKPALWRHFCTTLSGRLKELSKAGTVQKLSGPVIRDSAYSCESPDDAEHRAHLKGLFTHEWVITGRLRAASPFFFGLGGDVDNKQIDLRLLTNRQGIFRLPRSVIRGALREALHLATGEGCLKKLGEKQACLCSVCQVMRSITIQDALCDDSLPDSIRALPPDIRQRIRRDPATGTVDEGALFSQEIASEGLFFPFSLRFRGGQHLPEVVKSVLAWWSEGKLFVGGSGGTGKGDFILEGLAAQRWDLQVNLDNYIQSRGGRDSEIATEHQATVAVDELLPATSRPFPWQRSAFTLSFEGPVLNGDPIRALMPLAEGATAEHSPNAVFFQKRVVAACDSGPGYQVRSLMAIKAETFRGLLRNAVGKRHDLLANSHVDCRCLLCRLFGNEHQRGQVRIGDFALQGGANREKLLDHNSIDRFSGGVVEKFNDQPLIGSPGDPLEFTGTIWFHDQVATDSEALEALNQALADIAHGLHPVGGKVGIGYGALSGLDIGATLEWLRLPEMTEGVVAETAAAAQATSKDYPALPNLALNQQSLYYPHYFVRPPQRVDNSNKPVSVKRETKMVSHARYDHDRFTGRFTGRIRCTLTTKSPLIIPDTSNADCFGLQADTPGHKSHAFFRLGNREMIPGAPLKAMVSSVFETLTNSCYRVMNQKEHLSWRMATNEYGDYRPGRVEADGKIKPMGEKPIRFPLYDPPDTGLSTKYQTDFAVMVEAAKQCNIDRWLTRPWRQLPKNEKENKIKYLEGKLRLSRSFTVAEKTQLDQAGVNGINDASLKAQLTKFVEIRESQKMANALATNDAISAIAQKNRQFLDAISNPADREEVITGREKIHFITEQTVPDLNFHLARLVAPGTPGAKQGYLKITGPNNVNIANTTAAATGYNPTWEDLLDYSFRLAGPPSCSPNTQGDRQFPRPGFTCIVQEKECRVSKRCERVFVDDSSDQRLTIPHLVKKQYLDILKRYEKNPGHIPKAFQTRYSATDAIPEKELVYFRQGAGDTVAAMIPVCISRQYDPSPLGKKLPNNSFRSCAQVCLEECEECRPEVCGMQLFREGILTKGLCPACHLFGAAGYQGRVRFGFARLDGEAKWQRSPAGPDGTEQEYVTLPLQEAPRPTWVIPDKEKKIPGRKFYVHHQGWRKIVAGQQILDGSAIEKTENNSSFETLAEGNTFAFEVHFENLSAWELGLLLYSLELQEGLAHKLGRGKPFGFGSVTVMADGLDLYDFAALDWKSRPDKAEFINTGVEKLEADFSQKAAQGYLDNLLKALTFNPSLKNMTVCYPSLEEVTIDFGGQSRPVPGYIKLKEMGANPNQDLAEIWKPWHRCK